MQLFPPTSPQDRQSDQESDTTAEPQSEPEDFDDRRSDSIASSVAIHEIETSESEARERVTTEEVSETDGTPNGKFKTFICCSLFFISVNFCNFNYFSF